jgi:hypothetical protein
MGIPIQIITLPLFVLVRHFASQGLSFWVAFPQATPRLPRWLLPNNISLNRECTRAFISGCGMPLETARRYYAVKFARLPYHSVHLGNAIMLLMTAVLFCELTGIVNIDASALDGVFHTFTTDRGIIVWANSSMPRGRGMVHSRSSFSGWGIPICSDWNMTLVAHTFRRQFLERIPRKNIPKDTVVLSMRGSDIMRKGALSCYWQPPCSFFTDVQKQFDRAIILCVDYTNPCVNVSIAKGGVFGHVGMIDDFATLVSAPNVVLCRSSFGRAALYLSQAKQSLYVFEGDAATINSRWNMFTIRYLEHGDHWDCLASKRYKDMIIPDGRIGRWAASREQLDLLLNDTCTWTRATLASQPSITLPEEEHDVGAGFTVRM